MKKFDICIIGAGAGGLSVAAGAAQMGAKVVLIERGAMGGDCLNSGCVPSKALLAAAHQAHTIRHAADFGIHSSAPTSDWKAVHNYVQSVVDAIAPNDSQERFEALGVQVIRGSAEFIDAHTIAVGEQQVQAKFIVVATGSSPFVPPIEGLDSIPYFTNENIFQNEEAIEHLIVIGGGPIGIEMAQAHLRLGAKVSVIEMGKVLPKDDPELSAIVIDQLRAEGMAIYEGSSELRFSKQQGQSIAHFKQGTESIDLAGSHVLIATGRRANVQSLQLKKADVLYSPHGIDVDARLRSSQKHIFAIGDVAGPYQFTHMAAYQAGIIIRNMLFRLPAKVDYRAVPWVTYTDPELAHVGMSIDAAKKHDTKSRVLSWSFKENDRAQAESRTEGMIKVSVAGNGRILGASIVGLHAGELIQPWVFAIQNKHKIGSMAATIAPYPTLAEVNKRIAGSFYTDKIFSSKVRRIVRLLLRLPTSLAKP